MINYEKVILILLTCQTGHFGVFFIQFTGQKYITIILRLIWFARSCSELRLLVINFNVIISKLQLALMILGYIFPIFTGIILTRKREYIEVILAKGLSHLTNNQKWKIICLFIATLVLKLSMFETQLKLAEVYDPFSLDLKFIAYFTRVTYFYDEWISPSVVVYSIVFIIIHSAKMNEIRRLQLNTDYFTWLKFLAETKKKKFIFNSNLSIFPSLWLINAFLTSAGILELLKNLRIELYVFLIGFNLLWISCIALVAKSYDDLESLVDITRLRICSNCSISSSDKVAINFLLNDLETVKVTASSMVTLDKSLFLPCIGYIITYTLLLKENFKD